MFAVAISLTEHFDPIASFVEHYLLAVLRRAWETGLAVLVLCDGGALADPASINTPCLGVAGLWTFALRGTVLGV